MFSGVIVKLLLIMIKILRPHKTLGSIYFSKLPSKRRTFLATSVEVLRSRGTPGHEYIHKAKILVGCYFEKRYIMNV